MDYTRELLQDMCINYEGVNMCFTSVIVVTWTSSSQASGRSGHIGDLEIHSCRQALLESTKTTSLSLPPKTKTIGHGGIGESPEAKELIELIHVRLLQLPNQEHC